MSEEVEATQESLAALLGLVVKHAGGEIRVPVSFIEEGFKPGQHVRVLREDDDLVVRVSG